jgi:hypothetical protein
MTKTLAQVGYEAFVTVAATEHTVAWEQIADPNPRRGSPIAVRAWSRVASAIERAVVERLLAEQERQRKAAPDQPVKCTTCKARFMAGEKHTCVLTLPVVTP